MRYEWGMTIHGRPGIRTEVLAVWLTRDEKDALRRDATRHQMTLSSFVRARLLYGDAPSAPAPGLPPYVGALAERLGLTERA